jgi:hypothetical protein
MPRRSALRGKLHLLDALELVVPLIGAPAGRPGDVGEPDQRKVGKATDGKCSMVRAMVPASRHGGQAQAHGRQDGALPRHCSDISVCLKSPHKVRFRQVYPSALISIR